MICEKCGTNVDNDLIFCTNCGVRLSETWNNSSTETQITNELQPPKKSSNLKWIALIIALFALPISLFLGYLFLKKDSPQVVKNTNKPSNVNTSPTKKPVNKPDNSSSNSNSNSNSANTESNSANSNTQSTTKSNSIKIDRLEIEPNSHTAYPFTVESETAKIVGKIEISNDEKLLGYVFTQQAFDEHFPDETYKMFSFEGNKTIEIEQTLIKEKYVIVFINENENSVVIEGNLKIQ